MPDTHGFEVVAEVDIESLRMFLRSAWDNGGTNAPGTIPHEVMLDGVTFGPYRVEHGQVQIPREGLSLDMAPSANGVEVGLGTNIQVALDPDTIPVDSLSFLEMSADISITAPFGIVPGTDINMGIIFEGLPRNNVVVSITSGDPIGPITDTLIAEYIHNLYQENAEVFPHTITLTGQSSLGHTFDVFVEFYDDPSDPARQISVQRPDPDHVSVTIPTYIRLSNISGPMPILSPMGVTANLVITAPYEQTSGQITAALTDPATTVEVLDLAPAPGTEGTNYSLNKTGASAMGIDLDLMFKEAISATGRDMVQGMGDIIVECPTLTDIETFIGDRVHQEVVARSFMGVWTPETPEGSPVTINDLRPKALADALAIGINAGAGADENLLERFISPDQAMGIALDGAFVIETIGDIINRPESEGGFGGIPRDFSNIEGHDARLNTLNWELRNGAIHFSGDVTVFDVFCGADADCTFWADIGLRWLPPDASGRQTLEPFMIDHDVDLPWWAWLLAVLGFIFGLILGVIAIVITVVVENIAERVGGAVMEDEVSGQLQTIGAWPQQLQGIGTVETTFQEDVLIEPSGLMFAVNYTGSITVTATYALTLVFPAQAGGPYSGPAGMPIDFFAVPNPKATHQWDFGDGHTATGNHVSHTYEDDGLYIARLTTTVLETGGATTHHSVAVRMQNVPPVVDAGPDIVVDEGQEFSLRGSFSDQEWKDTHEAVWIFGDDTLPETGIVTENNDPPRAEGVVTGSHAYCDSGEFSVTLRVRDDDGGVSEDTLKVTVRNVAPTVEAGDYVFAYPCTPITLVAHFTDPGWCDTHTAVWDFGDCTPPMPATVREVNEPPEAYGIAAATHTYNSCGTYLAKCTVTDDDGGTTEDTVVVHAIHVLNRDFEGGFRNRLAGTVANAWEPYIANEGVAGAIAASDQPSGKAGISFFKAEEFVVHSGQRSQCITGAGNFRAGIYQKVGANPDWDYQVSVWYHLDERAGGACRLGIDPTGGNDPASADIEWTKGNKHRNWAQLVRRVTAEGHNITIFLEAVSEDRGTAAFFDDVTLAPYPCPLEEPEKPEEQPSEPKEQCVNWRKDRGSQDLGTVYAKEGFTFQVTGNGGLHIVQWGEPQGQGKLALARDGVRVQLPFVSDHVHAHVVIYTSEPIIMTAFDEADNEVGQASTTSEQNKIQILEIEASGIKELLFTGGGNEGLLLDLCASQGQRYKGKGKQEREKTAKRRKCK